MLNSNSRVINALALSIFVDYSKVPCTLKNVFVTHENILGTTAKEFNSSDISEVISFAFYDLRFKSISLQSAMIIGDHAFYNSPLIYLSIPSAQMIGDKAFASIVNSPKTIVSINSKFNDARHKDRIFGFNNWNHISFIYVNDKTLLTSYALKLDCFDSVKESNDFDQVFHDLEQLVRFFDEDDEEEM